MLLEELEQPSIPEIDEAAENYVCQRDTRMHFGRAEAQAKQALHDLMKEKGLSVYEFDGRIVRLDTTENVVVEKKKVPKDDIVV